MCDSACYHVLHHVSPLDLQGVILVIISCFVTGTVAYWYMLNLAHFGSAS